MLPLRDNVPTRIFPVVTYGLIAANFAVWFWELRDRGVDEIDRFSFYPCDVHGPCPGVVRDHAPWWESVFTSMFMHASWVHILGNMLFLWIFGNNVEDALGRVRFLVFYLAAGSRRWRRRPRDAPLRGPATASVPNLGASGAISAVLGAYLVLLPRRERALAHRFFFFPESRVLFLGPGSLLQPWDGGFAIVHPASGGGVAFFAHVAGFVFGIATVRCSRSDSRWRRSADRPPALRGARPRARSTRSRPSSRAG